MEENKEEGHICVEKCPICYNIYDSNHIIPVVLHTGTILCLPCTKEIYESRTPVCPNTRFPLSPGSFPRLSLQVIEKFNLDTSGIFNRYREICSDLPERYFNYQTYHTQRQLTFNEQFEQACETAGINTQFSLKQFILRSINQIMLPSLAETSYQYNQFLMPHVRPSRMDRVNKFGLYMLFVILYSIITYVLVSVFEEDIFSNSELNVSLPLFHKATKFVMFWLITIGDFTSFGGVFLMSIALNFFTGYSFFSLYDFIEVNAPSFTNRLIGIVPFSILMGVRISNICFFYSGNPSSYLTNTINSESKIEFVNNMMNAAINMLMAYSEWKFIILDALIILWSLVPRLEFISLLCMWMFDVWSLLSLGSIVHRNLGYIIQVLTMERRRRE